MDRDEVAGWLDGVGAEKLCTPEVGSLLVAMPSIGDPYFDRAVVLIVGDFEEGYQGVILTEPTREDVRSRLPKWWRAAMPPRTIHRGGPCEPELVLGLAVGRHDLVVEGIEPIARYRHQTLYRVAGTVQPDEILARISGVRLFRGYAGWEPEQLDYEIEAGAWLVVPSQADDAVSARPAMLWREVLARQSGTASFLRACPDNPERN